MKTPCTFKTNYGRKDLKESTIIINIVETDANWYIITVEWPDKSNRKHRTRNTYTIEHVQELAGKIINRVKGHNFPWQDRNGVNQWIIVDDHDINF